ncbi:MAG: aminodeoxychorismate lyase [Mycobacteriaceae bacterium]|nr:aminodeoxychorismate lyase [Mycobacteriaceae bacterium]
MADEDLVLITLDGRPHDPRDPLLHADDLAVLRGDGVFETVLVRDGAACAIELHLGRLRRSAEMIELPEVDLDEWRTAVAAALKQWGAEREGVMRLVLSRGRETTGAAERFEPKLPTAYLSVGPVPERVRKAREHGVSVVTLPRGYSVELAQSAPWLGLGAKTLAYGANQAALRFARRNSADDAIFISTENRVLEGTHSTVLVWRDEQLLTPPHRYGVVPGTTQRALFEVAEKAGLECRYKPLFAVDLILADGLWLLSSTALAARVHTLDGLPKSEPEFAPRLVELVDEATRKIGALRG